MARHRASGHTIGVPRELWQAVFFIRTTYPDRICYRPGVMIASANPDGAAPPPFHPDVLHLEFCSAAIPPGCLTSGILLRRHSTRMSHIRHTPSPDISHPAPDAGWERRAFQLPRLDISGSSDSAYPESFVAILHSAAVFS
uniref:Uncharacterized protein n=1 Tax=Vitis vinifera TaxID=29760 RepID=A5AH65_VITVI|nr:hypothetical protein VITISV_016498 [Vitis vinifera]